MKYNKDNKFNDDADWTKFYGEVKKKEDPHDAGPIGCPCEDFDLLGHRSRWEQSDKDISH